MGTKLLACAALAVAGLTTAAHADPAADAAKKGFEAFKEGKYDEAVKHLEKSYELDAKPETLYALAQAERLSGDCTSAAAHYHKVIDQMPDLNVSKLVQQNLSLCEKDQPKPPDAKPEPAPPPAAASAPAAEPEPKIVTKTVVREVSHTDKLAMGMLAGGTLAVGASVGLYLAAHANDDASLKVFNRDDYNSLRDKASTERTAMYVAGVAGVAALGYAVFRYTRHTDAKASEVAVVPTETGGTLWVTGRF
jgi:tetratricopeptide (TPR) repeat protein